MSLNRRQFSLAVTSLGLIGLFGCNDTSTPKSDFGAPGTVPANAPQSSDDAYAEQQRLEKEQAKKK